MRHYILFIAFFIALGSQAQQVNPVPDYVFRNQMSVGRNAVTDTAAYMSIGPRYGAIRGMMPPMVTDTASMSATKRNGLLIFSIQKNKYLYWDSIGVKWAEMAGTAGSAITGSGVSGYIPEFTSNSNLDTTKLYHSGGKFTIGSTSYLQSIFNVYGDARFRNRIYVDSPNIFIWKGANSEVSNLGVGEETLESIIPNTGTDSRYNTAIGTHVLRELTTGSDNTGVGAQALRDNISGYHNTAVGHYALGFGTTLAQNTAIGTFSGNYTSSGVSNVFVGMEAGYNVTTGSYNIAIGRKSMMAVGNSGITGSHNIAIGNEALVLSKTSSYNVAIGRFSQSYDSLGSYNTTIGDNSGNGITSGTYNTFIGTGSGNGITTGSFNTVIGANTNGLLSSLRKNIIIANGNGEIKAQHDSTVWLFDKISIETKNNNFPFVIDKSGSYNMAILSSSASNNGNTLGLLFGYTGSTYQKGAIIYESLDGNARGKMHIALNGAANSSNVTVSDSKMSIDYNGELLINTTTDAGDYKLQVAGRIYNTTGAVFAANSGSVIIGSSTPNTFASGSRALQIGVNKYVNLWEQSNGAVNLSFAAYEGSTNTYNYVTTGDSPTLYQQLSGAHIWSNASSGTAGNTITFNERIRIHANGGLKFVGQSASPTAEAGTVYYDTDDNKLKVYNGTTWVDLH